MKYVQNSCKGLVTFAESLRVACRRIVANLSQEPPLK